MQQRTHLHPFIHLKATTPAPASAGLLGKKNYFFLVVCTEQIKQNAFIPHVQQSAAFS
jgi:hypothetical protein